MDIAIFIIFAIFMVLAFEAARRVDHNEEIKKNKRDLENDRIKKQQ